MEEQQKAVRRGWELVGPALLLASDAGSMITGAVLVVDAGATVAPSGRG